MRHCHSLILLLCLALPGCSVVSYRDGETRATRFDMLRETRGEQWTVAAGGMQYGVDRQTYESALQAIKELRTWLVVLSAEKTLRNRNDNETRESIENTQTRERTDALDIKEGNKTLREAQQQQTIRKSIE